TKLLKPLLNKDVIKDSSKAFHIVCSQQTLFSIAKHYGTKADSLKIWNNIGAEGLQFDQKIMTSKRFSGLKTKFKTFVVKQTSTIEEISTELNINIEDLSNWNDKKSGFFLQGELLRIKN
ncbi:MAG: LysM peptidoglycan-binding domain-containing protein, partial [Cytophagales bacterium]